MSSSIIFKALFGALCGASVGFAQVALGSLTRSRNNHEVVAKLNKKYPSLHLHNDLQYCVLQLNDFRMYADQALHILFKHCDDMLHLYDKFNKTKATSAAEDKINLSRAVFNAGLRIKSSSEDAQSAILAHRTKDHTLIMELVQTIQKIAEDVWFNVHMDTQVMI